MQEVRDGRAFKYCCGAHAKRMDTTTGTLIPQIRGFNTKDLFG